MTQNTLSLQHISLDYANDIKSFVPRVPKSRAINEDDSIPRVCTSSSIEGCMKGHPLLEYHFNVYPTLENYSPYEDMDRLTILLEKNLVGVLAKVYHFNVAETSVWPPQKLHSQGLVGDALISDEHWLLKEMEPSSISYALILSMANEKEKDEYVLFDSWEEVGEVMTYMDYHTLKRELPTCAHLVNKVLTPKEALFMQKEVSAYHLIQEEKMKSYSSKFSISPNQLNTHFEF